MSEFDNYDYVLLTQKSPLLLLLLLITKGKGT